LHEISHIKFLPRARPELVEGYLRALFIFDLSLKLFAFRTSKRTRSARKETLQQVQGERGKKYSRKITNPF